MINTVSFAKSNIHSDVIEAQKAVMSLFPNVKHTVFISDNVTHAQFCDLALAEWNKGEDAGALMFLDIDCIPIAKNAFDFFEHKIFAGNVQRSNHIENNKHLFVAPSCMYIGEPLRGFELPSFEPTNRGDVGEELSYALPVTASDLLFPTRFLMNPVDSSIAWQLNGALKPFGRFTFFGNPMTGEELFMHAFQMRLDSDRYQFLNLCREVVKKLT